MDKLLEKQVHKMIIKIVWYKSLILIIYKLIYMEINEKWTYFVVSLRIQHTDISLSLSLFLRECIYVGVSK